MFAFSEERITRLLVRGELGEVDLGVLFFSSCPFSLSLSVPPPPPPRFLPFSLLSPLDGLGQWWGYATEIIPLYIFEPFVHNKALVLKISFICKRY